MSILVFLALGGTAFSDVVQLLDDWDVEAAEKALKNLSGSASANPEAQYAWGRLRFQQGHYAEAVDFLRAAVADGADSNAKTYLELAQSVEQVTRDFVSETSPGGHFVIHVAPGKDQLLVPYLGEALEAQRAALLADLGYAPPEPVRVEIFSEVSDLARVSLLTSDEIEASGVIALCKWNRLMITSPKALLRGYPWLDAAAHEFVHDVVSRLTHDRIPIWLHEGIAKRLEQRWRRAAGERSPLSPASEDLLALALERAELIPLERLHPSIAKLPTQKDAALAFAQVATLVEHLEQRGGAQALKRLLEAVRDGMELEPALKGITGLTFSSLQKSWKAALKTQGLKKRGHLLPLALSFRKAGQKQTDDGQEHDVDPARMTSDAHAQRFARLGALLEERQRIRAAVAEYEKALRATKSAAPLISLRLARLYLELDDAARALDAAKTTSEIYPDLASAHRLVGEALSRLGRSSEAALEFTAAIGISPFDPRVHCGLAEVLRSLDDARAQHEVAVCRELQ